jgi:hypothetical protein
MLTPHQVLEMGSMIIEADETILRRFRVWIDDRLATLEIAKQLTAAAKAPLGDVAALLAKHTTEH